MAAAEWHQAPPGDVCMKKAKHKNTVLNKLQNSRAKKDKV